MCAQVSARPGVGAKKGVAWTLPTSAYFIQRKHTADSRDFGDMARVWAQQFEVDWQRVVAKERFVAMVGRSDRALLARDADQLQRGASCCLVALLPCSAVLASARSTVPACPFLECSWNISQPAKLML